MATKKEIRSDVGAKISQAQLEEIKEREMIFSLHMLGDWLILDPVICVMSHAVKMSLEMLSDCVRCCRIFWF